MTSKVSRPEEQNDQLLRLIAANKVRLAKLQQTIADLQQRTTHTGEDAHYWEKSPSDHSRAHTPTRNHKEIKELPGRNA